MAILSGRLAEQTMSPVKPPAPAAAPMTGPMGDCASPVCTPMSPVTALNGGFTPEPETKPARRRWSQNLHDSTVVAQAVLPLL
jgi:hypothetical protein